MPQCSSLGTAQPNLETAKKPYLVNKTPIYVHRYMKTA